MNNVYQKKKSALLYSGLQGPLWPMPCHWIWEHSILLFSSLQPHWPWGPQDHNHLRRCTACALCPKVLSSSFWWPSLLPTPSLSPNVSLSLSVSGHLSTVLGPPSHTFNVSHNPHVYYVSIHHLSIPAGMEVP